MSLRKIFISALCAACAVSLLVPAAFAHGCHRRAQSAQCGLCTVEGCTLTGPHTHGGKRCCGDHHSDGFCEAIYHAA